jgi:type VI secretion system secreted protein Hcp
MAQSDIFLKIETARAGPLRGETSDPEFDGQIDVVDWAWGMHSPVQAGGFTASGRVQIKPVTIRKRADSASTALMSALRSNDVVRKAVLSVRKAGGSKPVVCFTVTLEKGRILSYDVSSGIDAQGAPTLLETLTLGFTKITVDYIGQDARGGRTAASSYSDEISTPA